MGLAGWEIGLISAGSVMVAYAVLSAVLLRAPPLPWTRRKHPWPHDTRRIAHRGGSLLGPENTLYTFRKALDLGVVDMLELDVCLTKDGVVVVAHDDQTMRVCEENVSIPETDYADLPRLHRTIGLHFTSPTQNSYMMGDEEFSASTEETFAMPTLREVFEAFPDAKMHVDAKYQSEELARKTVSLIQECGREHITIVGSARGPNAKKVRELSREVVASRPPQSPSPPPAAVHGGDPSTPLRGVSPSDSKPRQSYHFACAEEVGTAYVLYYLGLLPLVPVNYEAFDIPLPTAHLRNVFNRPLISWLLNAPKMWRHLQRRGVRVYGFVVNSKEDLEEARDWPVDGIMTDDPVLFRETPWLAPQASAKPKAE